MTLDIKYTAGFVDADGSLLVHVQKRGDDRYGLYPKVNIGQLKFRSQLLQEIAEIYEVELYERKHAEMVLLDLTGSKAVTFINLIKGHLVIKDELAEYLLTLPKEVNKNELKAIKKVVKQLRRKNTPTKNHPSRKWMAGYIDGDGCFTGRVNKNGTLSTRLTIVSSCDALAGIELIKKAFGGSYRIVRNSSYYELSLGVQNTNKLYDFCGRHLRIKREQMELVKRYVGANKHSKYQGATQKTNEEFVKVLATTKYVGRQ